MKDKLFTLYKTVYLYRRGLITEKETMLLLGIPEDIASKLHSKTMNLIIDNVEEFYYL